MSAVKVGRRRAEGEVRQARTSEQAARVWDRVVQIALGIVVIFILIGTIGPTVRYWFSGQRAIVDTLSSATVYVGAGAEPVDTAGVAGIVGTRPLAVISLSSSDSLAKDPYNTCTGVVEQLRDLIVKVVVDGATVAGCEGKDIEFGSGVNTLGWDYVFWQTQSGADSLLVSDLPAITQQLALAYDAEVKGGRLIAAEREFSAPPNRWILTFVLAAVVVVGAVALFFLLQWLSRRYLAARDRRRNWEAERDRIDGELGDIAMIMVGVDPADRGRTELARTVGALADDYLRALADLDDAAPGDDISGLDDRVGRMRERLESAVAQR